jgi:tellurite methyltransferase
MNNTLRSELGNIDIYLFDQLLKGRYDHCENIIDIGCGSGRNIVYFLKNGFRVYGIDQDANAIQSVRTMSQQLSPGNPIENFLVSTVEDIPFQDSFFDLAICSAVLHFAKDKEHFDKMLRSIWRVLKPGGFLFARLASDIGIETLVKDLGNGRYLLPDGSQRFLVDQQTLEHYTKELNAELYEPIKTTNVSNLRCMTTWCIRKL